MPPTQGYKTSINPLVTQFLALLRAIEGLTGGNQVVLKRMKQPAPRLAAQRDAILRITGPRVRPELYLAGIEVTPAVTRGFIVQIRSRMAIDQDDQAEQWLLYEPTEEDPNFFGHGVLEDRVIAATQPWRPVDDDDNCLLIEPAALTDGSEFKDELAQIPPDDPTWGSSTLVFSITYYVSTQNLPVVEE